MVLHLHQAKLIQVLFTLRFAKFGQRFGTIDLSRSVAQQIILSESQEWSHHVKLPLKAGRVSRSDQFTFCILVYISFGQRVKAKRLC